MYNYVVTDFVVGCIKRVWFFSHRMSMYLMPWMWIFFDRLYGINIENIYFLIIMSWLLNNNRCLITQLEYFLFKETFMGSGEIFNVPFRHRFILYFNFAMLILSRIIGKIDSRWRVISSRQLKKFNK